MPTITTERLHELHAVVRSGKRVRCPVCRGDVRFVEIGTTEPKWFQTCLCLLRRHDAPFLRMKLTPYR
jgi:hypothetical protein